MKGNGEGMEQEERIAEFMKLMQEALEQTGISVAIEAGRCLAVFDTRTNDMLELEIKVGTEVVKKNGRTSIITFDYSNK